MVKKFIFIALVFSTSLFFIACEKDDPEIQNEEELITTLLFHLTPNDGGNTITLSFRDLDGDGGNLPIITGGILAANKTYTGMLELLNETVSPAEDISDEIAEEDAEHQFFYQTTIPNLEITYSDQDADGNPVGLNCTVMTGAAATGTITVILRHEPDKFASGVSAGNITNAGGETDIQVTFPLTVQ